MKLNFPTMFRIMIFMGLIFLFLNPLMNLWLAGAQLIFGHYMEPLLLLLVLGSGIFAVSCLLAAICSLELK